MTRSLLAAALACVFVQSAGAGEPIRLPNHPALSPDGKTVAFDWNGDIWTAPVEGGLARPLTSHPARDMSPRFSPDGKEIAFVSEREGVPQVFVMPAIGGVPRQMTFHSAWTAAGERAVGFTLYEWLPDGKGWLVGTQWDDGWGRRNNDRLRIVRRWDDPDRRPAPELVFDDYAQNGTLSSDGKTVLFNREGPEWWRKGYAGSQGAQLWSFDRETKSFARVPTGEFDSRWPMWGRDGKVYYANAQGGCFNIWEHDRTSKQSRQVTHFTDDSIVFPAISRDGSTIVFRHLFDLYRVRPGPSDEAGQKIDIFRDADRPGDRIERRVLTTRHRRGVHGRRPGDGVHRGRRRVGDGHRAARAAARHPHGRGGAEPVFSPDGRAAATSSATRAGRPEIWKASARRQAAWFRTRAFKLERVTDDGERSRPDVQPGRVEDGLRPRPGRPVGVADATGRTRSGSSGRGTPPEYDWSPDGKWLVYALYDEDFNRDIWIRPVDGSRHAVQRVAAPVQRVGARSGRRTAG